MTSHVSVNTGDVFQFLVETRYSFAKSFVSGDKVIAESIDGSCVTVRTADGSCAWIDRWYLMYNAFKL